MVVSIPDDIDIGLLMRLYYDALPTYSAEYLKAEFMLEKLLKAIASAQKQKE